MNEENPHGGLLGDEARLVSALRKMLRSLIFRPDPNYPLQELPVSQLRCVHIVAEQPGLRMANLADILGVGLPAASQIVERLVRRGMLARTPDPEDRRAIRISLTPDMQIKMDVYHRHRGSVMKQVMSQMSISEMNAAAIGLEALARCADLVAPSEMRDRTDIEPRLAEWVEPVAPRKSNVRQTKVSPMVVSGGQ